MNRVKNKGDAGPARNRPARTRREQAKLDKRARIREAAWQLFTTAGFDATTTKAVAARAGVASGTLFLYAKDKRDLLFLVFEERLGRVVDERFASLPRRAPLVEQLMYVFRGLFEMYGEHPAVAMEFVRSLPGAAGVNAEAVQALTLSFISRMASLVHQGQQRGELASDVEPMRAAFNVFWLYFGALTQWMAGLVPLEVALDPGLRESLALQVRALLPRP